MQFPTRCWFVRSVSVYTELSARSTREYPRTKVYNYPVRAVRPPVRQSALRLIYDARLWRTRTIRGVEGAVDWGGRVRNVLCKIIFHIDLCVVHIYALYIYECSACMHLRRVLRGDSMKCALSDGGEHFIAIFALEMFELDMFGSRCWEFI